MISVKNVTKLYGKFTALDNINFEIDKGDIVGFLGPNGAGKTTTMRIITGFMPPTYGDVQIDGKDVFEEPEVIKTMIGYLPEHPPLYPDLTVSEYLAFVAELKRVPKARIKNQVEHAIELTDLGERKNTLISFLSKGLKQRLGIAQAIVNSPKVLILDEPTVGLDPKQVIEIRNLIKHLAKEENRTVILSTHILAEASEICEKAIIINNGRILKVDTIDKIRGEAQEGVQIIAQVSRISEQLLDWLGKIDGLKDLSLTDKTLKIISSRDNREEIAKTIVDSGSGLVGLSRVGDSLEDAFIKLVR